MVRLSKLRRRLTPKSLVGRVFAGLICLGLVLLILEAINVTHIFHKYSSSKAVVTAGTPVSAPTQGGSSTQPPPKTATGNASSLRNSGTATDTQGTASASTNSSQWVTSASGLITVKQPTANSKLSDGSILSGSAKVGEVSYRLSDNEVGVIAQGTLSVVNGNFSGTLHFSSQGTGGRLDVFTTDSKGVEYNEVQINVSF